MLVDHGLELLTEDECLTLLATGEIGRVGVTIGSLPAIFPVNFRVLDGDVVLRTAPGSKLAAATAGQVVAFEVDDYEHAERIGWSVLVIGQAEVLHDIGMTIRVVAAGLEPWAGEEGRTSIIRIHPTFVSGRRIARPA